jgi:hypothetical protein
MNGPPSPGWLRRSLGAIPVFAALAVGCSMTASDVGSTAERSTSAAAGLDVLAMACTDSPDDVYVTPGNLPPFTPDQRGNVIRCAPYGALSAADLDAAARTLGYAGPTLASGATMYRIAYLTQRATLSDGTLPGGISSALVFLPDTPIATQHPLIVAGHGSVGLADTCAPSRGDVQASGSFLDDAHSLVLPLAGYGYTVVMPDYAGFGYGSTSGWLVSEDEAHSLLDSTFAVQALLQPGTLTGDVVLVGHSQGGHAVLSAQAYAGSYGLAGNLAGVVAEAPLWFAGRSWGAALTDVLGIRPTVTTDMLAYVAQYFYSHGELYDGAGNGTEMMQSSVQGEIASMMASSCLDTLSNQIGAIGQHPSDIFDATFSLSVATCADTGVCLGSTASTWWTRFHDDRPDVDPNGAPMVLLFGGDDTTVTPSYAQCGIDKINSDLPQGAATTATFCIDQDAIHGAEVGGGSDVADGITRRSADWINQWIAAQTVGAPAPAACQAWTGVAPDGSTISCPSLPPNSD